MHHNIILHEAVNLQTKNTTTELPHFKVPPQMKLDPLKLFTKGQKLLSHCTQRSHRCFSIFGLYCAIPMLLLLLSFFKNSYPWYYRSHYNPIIIIIIIIELQDTNLSTSCIIGDNARVLWSWTILNKWKFSKGRIFFRNRG